MPVRVHPTSLPAQVASDVTGHFGEFLQGRLGPDGPVALVTIPAKALRVRVRYAPDGPFHLHTPDGPAVSRRQIAHLFGALLRQAPRGRMVIRADMPVGGGAGSSTAGIMGVIRVISASARQAGPEPDAVAALCLGLEGATDPLMHEAPERLVWASREGRMLGRLPPLPPLEIVGGFAGAGRRTEPLDNRFADVSDLLAEWGALAARGDAAGLAALATESATRNVRQRGGGDLRPLQAAADATGALGIVAAHTGSARGLIFARRRGEPERAAARLRALGFSRMVRFPVGGSP